MLRYELPSRKGLIPFPGAFLSPQAAEGLLTLEPAVPSLLLLGS